MTAASTAPQTLRVRMYQVGFGDCFLLTAEYAAPLPDGRAERHVLIDCGSTREADGTRLAQVVQLIHQHTAGQLDVLVVTHRHKDHLSAFGLDGPAQLLEGLRPALVLRPWTEDPAAAADATGPVEHRSRQLVTALQSGSELASALARLVVRDRGARGDLVALAAAQLANQEAITRLDTMAGAAQARYLHAGQPSGIEELLPGLSVHVLGPPTVEQWPRVATEASNDPDYWIAQTQLLSQAAAAVAPGAGVKPSTVDPDRVDPETVAPAPTQQPVCAPGPARWLIDRMSDRHVTSLQRIVRSLDDAMNNTSLILLFDIAGQRLLFPGDAQIENWSFALSQAESVDLLREVNFYKVGHHGSRNGTPRSLVRLWQDNPTTRTTMMSTLPGVHGKTEATKVPRTTLVDALQELGPLYRTDQLEKGVHHLELEWRFGSTDWMPIL